MRILFDITICNFKHNKFMTFFYGVGIFISAVLLTSMIIFLNSSHDFQIKQSSFFNGDYEIMYSTKKERVDLTTVLSPTYIKEDIKITTLGYHLQEDGTFIRINGLNKVPDGQILHLQMGTFPKNEHEIMVSKEYLDAHHLQLNDKIMIDQLQFGKVNLKNHQFTVCGVYLTYTKDYDGNCFDQIQDENGVKYQISDEMTTQIDFAEDQEITRGYVSLQNMDQSDIMELKQTIADHHIGVYMNDNVIYQKYVSNVSSLSWAYIVIIGFFIVILIHMISNIAILTFKKRIHEIGMLNSIGATTSQLMICSVIESMIYAVVDCQLHLFLVVS